MNMSRKSRGALIMLAAVVILSVIAYLAHLPRSPTPTERNTWEDVNTMVRAIDLESAPSPELLNPNPVPDSRELQNVDQAALSLIEATTSDQQEVQEASQFLGGHGMKDRVLLRLANLSPQSINGRGSVSQQTGDANSPRSPVVDVLVNPFSISESLTLPVPLATLPPKKLVQQQWVSELQQILLKIPQGLAPVSITSVDYKFREVLINWLVAAMTQAHPPLTHIIVFSLDQPLCELLKRRNINCIFVAPKAFLTQKAITHLNMHAVFSEVMVLRLTAMRLMNHWGYDTANYDTDAIVLKSPESLYLKYSNSNLIGSHGNFPRALGRKWGTTVCCGVFLTKSSPHTEIFWNTIATIQPNSKNDQIKLNHAISSLHPNWGNTTSKSILTDEWTATTSSGFSVTVLPGKYICRHECSREHRSEYYVWHKGGATSRNGKMKYFLEGNSWFLREDWEARTIISLATGEEWLKEITAPAYIV